MTTSDITPPLTNITPIQCAPWCTYGDGHPKGMFREDQRCYSPFSYIAPGSADGEVGAHAQREIETR